MIKFHDPDTTPKDLHVLEKVLSSGVFVGGEFTQKLEDWFESSYDAHAIAVSNCSDGIRLVFEGLRLTVDHRKALVPTNTFVGVVNAIEAAGYDVVLFDCNERLQPSYSDFRDIVSRVKDIGVVVVFDYGGAVDPDRKLIIDLAEKHGICVVHDAAHSLMTADGFEPRAIASVFSFHPTKPCGSGRGGIVVTSNSDLADYVRCCSMQGLMTPSADGWLYDCVTHCGSNSRIDEWNAALIFQRLTDAIAALRHREMIASAYDSNLNPQIWRVRSSKSSWHLYPIVLPFGTDREKVRSKLSESGVQTSIHWRPLHMMSAWINQQRPLTVATTLLPRQVSLPIHKSVTVDSAKWIAQKINLTS